MSAPHPRWTLLGTLASPARGLVDGRGRVSSAPGWAMDWWVGAEDRWHLPRYEASVRQHLVADTPVVETAVHIPGGDAVHRAYAVRDRGPSGDGADLLVVEIENRSAVPFALALVVGPYDPYVPEAGAEVPDESVGGSVSSLALDAGPEGSVLVVDGRPGLLLAKAPARATSVVAGGDLLAAVAGGQAPLVLEPVACPDGGALAALIYPLPHTAVLRVVLPLDAPDPVSVGAGRRDRRDRRVVSFPSTLTSAEQVAKGWEVQARRPMTVTVPDPRWTAVTEANRAFLLLGADESESWVTAVDTVGALDRWGFHDEAARLLSDAGDPLRDPKPIDPAMLVALADHLALTGDRTLVEELAPLVALAVRRADRPTRRQRLSDQPGSLHRAAAGGVEWRARGLAAAVGLLEAIEQPDAARVVGRRARRLEAAAPAPPTVEPGPLPHPGWPGALSPADTLRQAAMELARSTSAAISGEHVGARVAWALSVIGPTLVWPEAVHPDRPLDALGRGHDPVAGAAWLLMVRTLLVRESGSATAPELAVCSWWPTAWRGQNAEVHHAPTAHGELSYAVRWHGDRPALLWELTARAEPSGLPVTLRAPGLDGSWSTREPRGEALLARVVDEAGRAEMSSNEHPDRGASFS